MNWRIQVVTWVRWSLFYCGTQWTRASDWQGHWHSSNFSQSGPSQHRVWLRSSDWRNPLYAQSAWFVSHLRASSDPMVESRQLGHLSRKVPHTCSSNHSTVRRLIRVTFILEMARDEYTDPEASNMWRYTTQAYADSDASLKPWSWVDTMYVCMRGEIVDASVHLVKFWKR